MSLFFTWKSCHKITHLDGAVLNLSLESAEFMVGSADSLYRHIETFFCVFFDVYSFQMCKECFACIPWHVVRFCCNIVPLCSGYRNDGYIDKLQLFDQTCDLVLDLAETFLIVTDQVHFIYCKYEVTDSHQCTDSCMTSCLYQHSLRSIHKNNCQICE